MTIAPIQLITVFLLRIKCLVSELSHVRVLNSFQEHREVVDHDMHDFQADTFEA